MKLKKDLKVNIYEVIADYKVKQKNAPFIAILQFAEENNGTIEPSLLREVLLSPLSEKACENLLERLTKMGYFEKNVDNYDDDYDDYDDYKNEEINESNYQLTTLGYVSALNEEFYEPRNGLLKLYVTEGSRFIEQKIVKIEEYTYDPDRDKLPTNLNNKLTLLQSSTIINLKNDSFILDKFEDKCKILKDKTEQFILNAKENFSILTILDFEKNEDYSEQSIIKELLKNEFAENYLPEELILKIDFNHNKLHLQRDIQINKPLFESAFFKPINIPDVKVNPKTIQGGKAWHSALLKEQINKYFLSDNEFTEFSNKIANKFELYHSQLQNITTRQKFASKLNDKTDFYKKAKLETINDLSY